jgi:hypothetical protein
MAGRLSRSRVQLLAAGLCLASTALPLAASAGPRALSRYTRLSPCRRIGAGQDVDWVAYRCAGYERIPAWLAFTDSSKAHLGFGQKQNVSGVFAVRRERRWRVEWRGAEVRGRFSPFAVIVRVRDPGETRKSRLVVYHLRPDGTSCIIGEARRNQAARSLADRARDNFSCEEQPVVP